MQLITAAIGLLGVLVGAFISWRVNLAKSRSDLAWEMHREFNTDRMYHVRSSADKLLAEHLDVPLDKLHVESSIDETNPLWIITSFYERLWLSIEHNKIDKNIVPSLFGDLFVWWYLVHFKDRLLPMPWSAGPATKKLYSWISTKSDRNDLKAWRDRASSDKKKIYGVKHKSLKGV